VKFVQPTDNPVVATGVPVVTGMLVVITAAVVAAAFVVNPVVNPVVSPVVNPVVNPVVAFVGSATPVVNPVVAFVSPVVTAGAVVTSPFAKGTHNKVIPTKKTQ